MADFEIGQNDTLPDIVSTLKSNGTPIPLIGSTSVRFHLKKGISIVIDEPAAILDGAGGIVSYSFQAGDTALIGSYKGEWEITFAPGRILTVPRKKKISVDIVGELA